MAKQWEESGLRSIWNSLFDASEFSGCNENDVDLQGVSMLAKKMFYAFEKLKAKCEVAESAQRRPCLRCASLEKVIKAHKVKLRQTESRMKSIAHILNMGGGLSQEANASPGKQQTMAKALTQILFSDEMDISEDESEPDVQSAKRHKRWSPARVNNVTPQKKRSPVKVNAVGLHKRSPIKVNVTPQKRSPTKVNNVTPQKRGSPKRGRVVALESLPPIRNPNQERKDVVPETLGSQTVEETFLAPPTCPATPPTRSPVIGRRRKIAKKPNRLRLDMKLSNSACDSSGHCSLTSSPPLSSGGGSKSPFTPRLRAKKETANLSSPGGVLEDEDIFLNDEVPTNQPAVSKSTIPSNFVQSLATMPDLSQTFVSPSLISGLNPLATPAPGPHCDTNVVGERDKGSRVATRKQADFWKLKPSPTAGKEPINGHQNLRQTRIGFGVRPERTDLCTLREFNGGVRLGHTSTMMTADPSEEAEFERAILESLGGEAAKDTRSHDQGGFFSPQERSKQAMGDAVNFKENEATPPDTEDLLEEMGAASMPGRNVDHLIRDFDRVPKRHEDVPAYKYQRDTVRKHDERMKMEGWDCTTCQKYYAGRCNNSAERKELMNKCSKHRDKYKRNDTPPGYWNIDFPSTPELRARNLDITQKPVKFRTRKRRLNNETGNP